MEVLINESLKEEIDKMQKIVDHLAELKEKAYILNFLTVKDFMKITGWSEPTVQKLFNREDFPSCDFGKEKIAEVGAVINYFSVPRRKNET